MLCQKVLSPDDTVLLNDGDKCKLVELSDVRFFLKPSEITVRRIFPEVLF